MYVYTCTTPYAPHAAWLSFRMHQSHSIAISLSLSMTSYLGGLDDLVWQVDLREGVHGAGDLVQFDAFDRVQDLRRHLGLLVQLTQHSLLLL